MQNRVRPKSLYVCAYLRIVNDDPSESSVKLVSASYDPEQHFQHKKKAFAHVEASLRKEYGNDAEWGFIDEPTETRDGVLMPEEEGDCTHTITSLNVKVGGGFEVFGV